MIPGLDEDMPPQGIGYSEKTGLVCITSYAMDGTPFTGHVGGIAVTEDRVYLSAGRDFDGSYSVAELLLAELPLSGSYDVTLDRTISMPVSPSFLNCSQGILWVGNFYYPAANYELPPDLPYTTASTDGEYGCYILGYRLGNDGLAVPAGEMYPVPDLVLVAPDRIQGVVCLEDRVMLSQSYGRKNNSAMLVYSLTADVWFPPVCWTACGYGKI